VLRPAKPLSVVSLRRDSLLRKHDMSELIKAKVASRKEEAEGIVAVDLVAVDGTALPPFEAGDHIDVHLRPDLLRQYSLCGSPEDRSRYRLGVLREPISRGGSERFHLTMTTGTEVSISKPRGNFKLVELAPFSILLAGGIGVTPLLAMAHRLHELKRPFMFHYFVRKRSRAAFLDAIQASGFGEQLRLRVSDETATNDFDPRADLAWGADRHVYICGPSGFQEAMTQHARAGGWPDANIHKEAFGATISLDGASFQIVAKKSGVTVTVPEGRTILEALREAGVEVEVACEQGVCGTCLTRVIEGIPDHRDSFQTDDEKANNDQITVCCSRSLTPLLILDV
jgi:vanillate monooxygenase ferredoxin subunit